MPLFDTDENGILRYMLNDDSSLKHKIQYLFTLLQENWTKMEDEVHPIQDLQVLTVTQKQEQKEGFPKNGKTKDVLLF